jgi:tetratricopeptide (TPR) repeat protein
MNRQEMNFMTMSALRFAGLSGATLLLGISLATGAYAIGNEGPQPNQPQPITTPPAPPKADTKSDDKNSTEEKKEDKDKEKKSEQQFIDGYKVARAMVLGGQYESGIAAFHQLGRDEHPDVANYLGFAHRKLGQYDQSKAWYEQALASDPKHTRTLQYYGMWHLEQGNQWMALDHLERIQVICGTGCEDYRLLREAIVEGKSSY